MTQTVDRPASLDAPEEDALAVALRDPEVRASLAVIAQNAPTLAVLVAGGNALLARSRDIVENVNERVEVLRDAAAASDADYGRYVDLVRALGSGAPTISSLLEAPILRPEIVGVISRVGEAALEADRVTRGRRHSIGGVMKLVREIRDPQMQETIAFFLAFAKAFGRNQVSADPTGTGPEA